MFEVARPVLSADACLGLGVVAARCFERSAVALLRRARELFEPREPVARDLCTRSHPKASPRTPSQHRCLAKRHSSTGVQQP